MIKLKYFQACALALMLLLLGIVVTYLVDNVIEIEELSLASFANIVSAASGILTLVLALLIYRKFTGAQLLIDKQTEEVMSLIDTMSSFRFVFSKGNIAKDFSNFHITDIYLDETHIDGKNIRYYLNNKFKDHIFIAEKDTLSISDYLMELTGALYMPTSIVKVLNYHFNEATPWWVDSSDKLKTKKVIKVSLDGEKYKKQDRSSFYMKYVHIDPIRFSEALAECYDEAVEWIKTNNNDVFNQLNIKSKANE